jgi:multidrug efflux pump subunit AcrA (membrane-fusion protein)
MNALLVRSTAAILLLVPLAGCSRKSGGDDEENRAKAQPVVAVRTAPVIIGDALVTVSAVGKTEALRREKVFSPIAGKVTGLNVLEGASVHAGDVLVSVLNKESQAGIAGAEGLLRAATTEQQKQEAQRALALARASQSVATITAKFDGIVASRSVSEGELVAEGAELVSLVDLSTIVFSADIPLRDVPSIRTGMSALVQFPSLPDRRFRAVVDALMPQSDAQSQTVRARLSFAGLSPYAQSLLRTEIIGTAQVITGVHPRTTIVPKSALLRDDEKGTYSVVIVTPDSVALTVPVVVGVATDSTVEVKSERLKAGMPVVISGNYALADSTKVTFGIKDEQ